ncbi:MAG: hypothetical protein ACLGPL_12435 [Acidobacteriota bacterium]
MIQLARNCLVTVLLGCLAICMAWYGITYKKVLDKDYSFQKDHSSVLLYPEAWLLSGNMAYFADMDLEKAVEGFQRAIDDQPMLVNAWLALAKTELARGNEESARRILHTLMPHISKVSYWKWQELLLSDELREEEHFDRCFNFILNRLPLRVSDACYLAKDFWKNLETVLSHVRPENHQTFLNELVSMNEVDFALSLWRRMKADGTLSDVPGCLRFCCMLIDNKRYADAREVWTTWKGMMGYPTRIDIFDGGFEQEPLSKAFAWHIFKHADFSIERSSERPIEGKKCLHLQFRGTRNIDFKEIYQYVPVEPGRTYRLKFAQRTRNLTTDQGIYLEIKGILYPDLYASSKPVNGTMQWRRDQLEFSVPDGCNAIVLGIRRKTSLMLNNKISGDYWIDDISLEEAP